MTSKQNVEAREARRRVRFAWNLEHARWGRFAVDEPRSSEDTAGRPPTPGLIICGVCGLDLPDQMAKADHLGTEHAAQVRVVEGPMYEWHRRP